MVKIHQNLFQRIVDIFNEMHPECEANIFWVDGLHDECEAWGETVFPDDGSDPIINIDVNIPVNAAIEIIAHELAHLAVGIDCDHDEKWESKFSEIHDKWFAKIEFNEENK